MSNIKILIENNLPMLYSLKAKGVKSINTALDYIVIYQTYELFHHIPDKKQRKEEVADRCKVTTRTVEQALHLLDQPISL